MHSAMEQAKYWMWTRRKFPVRPLYESVRPMPIPAISFTASQTTSFYNESWEEKVFAEDSAGLLGGCVWPPRSYTCSFCGREFRSAQALGGHMNVHRRDRARLKQSCIAGEDDQDDLQHLTALPNSKPTPKPLPKTPLGFEVSLAREALYSPLSLQMVDDVDYSGARSLLKVVPELKLWGEELIVGSKRRLVEKNELQNSSSKRKKMNHISIYTDEELKVSGAEVINLSSETVEELDLELRLGDMHQV